MACRCSPLTVAAWLGALIVGLALAGCGALNRDPPDAFAVTTHPPLEIPSDFSLPPPRPGVGNPHEESPRQQAEAVLVPEVVLSGDRGPDSPGQRALVRAAGPPAPRNIRQLIDREAGHDAGGVADSLLFWKSASPAGTPLNPEREAARLQRRGAATAPGPATTAEPAKNSGSDAPNGLF